MIGKVSFFFFLVFLFLSLWFVYISQERYPC